MLTIKVGELERVYNGLQKIILASDERGNSIPTDIQYWAFRLQKKLEGEFKAITDTKIPLLKKFGYEVYQQQPGQMKKGENGQMIPATFPSGRYGFNNEKDQKEYEKEMAPILEKEVTVESNIHKKTFKAIVELKLGTTLLYDLESVLQEDADDNPKDVKLELVDKDNKENKESVN